MSRRPRLLDLFCCEGGAAAGYVAAGFDLTGVDIKPQKRYPFAFVQGDALEYLAAHGREFDAIHASPPCQRFSRATAADRRTDHPDLIEPTRRALVACGRPWIMENVPGSPVVGVTVCGTSLGLPVRRHRLFESPLLLMAPKCSCVLAAGDYPASHRLTGRRSRFVACFGNGRYKGDADVRRAAMQMPWASLHGVNQAVPPAYTRMLGAQLLDQITPRAVAA